MVAVVKVVPAAARALSFSFLARARILVGPVKTYNIDILRARQDIILDLGRLCSQTLLLDMSMCELARPSGTAVPPCFCVSRPFRPEKKGTESAGQSFVLGVLDPGLPAFPREP